MRFLLFGTYDVRHHPRVEVLRQGLAELRHEAVELNEPLAFSTAKRIDAVRSPAAAARFGARLARRWASLWRRSRRVRGPFDAVIVGYLGQFDVHLARRLFPASPIVLDLLVLGSETASSRGLLRRKGLRSAALERIDRLALNTADRVLVDTDEHAELVRAFHPSVSPKLAVCPVGATREWFRAGERHTPFDEADALRACYFGLYTPFHGTSHIAQAIAELQGERIEFTMIGTGQDLEEARRIAPHGRTRWIDWLEPEELPGTVASHHVCLGVFGDDERTRRVVPNKIYQGAAAGCALVTADVPPVRRAFGEAAALVPPADSDTIVDTLRSLVHERERLTTLRSAARSRAGDFSPAAVAATLVEALRSARSSGPRC